MAIHEECGVFGIHGRENCAGEVYYGLFSLQHRGQESCGIVSADTDDFTLKCVKGMGLVSEVLTADKLEGLTGDMAIGHVRYSTSGASVPENAQPIVSHYSKGTISIAHNGNLTNADELGDDLAHNGAIFHTTTDSEVIAYLIALKRASTPSVEEAVREVMGMIKGGYALLVMSPRKLIAARDPWGLKPLVMGNLDGATVFCSETCALEAVGAEFVRDINPGEMVVVEDGEVRSLDSGLKSEMRKVIGSTGSTKSFFTWYKSDQDAAPAPKTKLFFVTNHDDATEGTPATQFKSNEGALAAYVLMAALNGSSMLYGSQEVGYNKTINFFNTQTMDWTANADLKAKYQQALQALAKVDRSGAMVASESEGVVYVAYPKALVGVNVSGKACKASLPKANAGKNGVPTSQDFGAYEYKIWTF